MVEVDVFISNYTLVDPEIYELWIQGYTATEAVSYLYKSGLGQITGVSKELIASDVLDHFRTYSLLEKLLSNPNKLQEQLSFQIEPQTRQLLIEKYYEIDDGVIKELLGKKLSSKHRKDLDEVSEKTNVPLKSCRRQFDNVKRVFKMVEEVPGSLVQNIQNLFYLPEKLAKKYACIVFFACIRFETSKKKLQHLTFEDWRKCTEAIMDNWSYKMTGPEYYDTEMDKEFLLELREIKVLIDREKEHKQMILIQLKPKLLQKIFNDLEANFRLYSRPLILLATTLHRSRDMKNLFIEIIQIVEIFKQASWSVHDLDEFLHSFYTSGLEIDIIRTDSGLKSTLEKYMTVIKVCLHVMY
ncbi:unnamed protein product [Brassicogethes aeneus]|uniref:Acidic fibroblast growth factor intracellular-binding protein n=1 Tax=Brassicogethes aeneus TaxID=1431903 RepID=A0A9P0FDC8_BRAAE|nr:unnamed protein product [Brassicogethes aeneus]